MLQRVGLAQALMHEPTLLILDEPSDGVDPVGRRQIRDILNALEAKGVTIFLNSHLLAEVELFCRDVAIIHKGKLALEGKVRDLTAGSGYRVEAGRPPERLVDELRLSASAFSAENGQVELHFPSRETANRAVDLLRAEKCEIESMARTRSTLEEVFIRTINGQ
jgi:ABC-2 type transport system ATP-binding protein